MSEYLAAVAAGASTLMVCFALVGLGVRYALLPWLREHLVAPVAATQAQVEETGAQMEFNGGSSMRDDVHGIAVALGLLQREVDGLSAQLTTHLENQEGQPYEPRH
jgi:hypothetical protein